MVSPTHRSRSRSARVAALLVAAVAFGSASAGAQIDNIMLVILDDVGVDLIAAYGAGDPANTPVIDGLAANGMRFENAWATPVCSPARAAMLTGRHGFRTGVGRGIGWFTAEFELSVDEVTIADLIAPTHASFAAGKWHLSAKDISDGFHPLLLGFEHHRGSLPNLGPLFGDGYFDYTRSVDGIPFPSTNYATTDTVDDALTLIATTPEPWFAWVSFNAPHGPFHVPPAELHTYALPPELTIDTVPIHGRAMLEALDTELGRLLTSMDPAVLADTTIIVVGDNGTGIQVVTEPHDPAKAKETVYQGGVHVPLIVSGPGVVPGSSCDALVNVTDIHETVVELAGHTSSAEDSFSFVPFLSDPDLPTLRTRNYTENFSPNGFGPFDEWQRAARDPRFKLIQFHDNGSLIPFAEEFYDLENDPLELVDLLAAGPLSPQAAASRAALTGYFSNLLKTWATAPDGPYVDLGQAMVGTAGTPQLAGDGDLIDNAPITFTLTDALPSAAMLLTLGLDMAPTGLKGGVLVPSLAPPGLVVSLVVGPTGTAVLPSTWPAGWPPGVGLFLQAWILDPAGPKNLVSSNALMAKP